MRLARTLIGLFSLVTAGACDGGETTSPSAPASILLATNSIALALGGSYTIEPLVLDAQRNNITSRATLSWSSNNPAIASVDDHGVVTGRALGGPATITVTAGDASAVLSLRVTPARIAITPELAAIELNSTVQFTGVAYDYFGNSIDVGAIAWASSAPGIASIDADGVLRAIAVGDVQITATAANYTSSLAAFIGTPTPFDGGYAGQGANYSVEVQIVFGRVTRFTGTAWPSPSCAIPVSAAPNAVIGAVISNGFTFPAPPANNISGTFNDPAGPTSVHGFMGVPTTPSCNLGGLVNATITYVAHRQ